jgi:hypothetical protein
VWLGWVFLYRSFCANNPAAKVTELRKFVLNSL